MSGEKNKYYFNCRHCAHYESICIEKKKEKVRRMKGFKKAKKITS
jgi:hypothetical protein